MRQSVHTLIHVAVPVPLRRTFDYLLPDEFSVPSPGTRVKVPFGRQQLIGIVTGCSTDSDIDPQRLKPISAILDEEAAILSSVFRLCQWASSYYHHPIGDVLSHALPTLLRKKTDSWQTRQIRWHLTQPGRLIDVDQLGRAKRQIEALSTLRAHPDGLHAPVLKGLGIQSTVLRALEDKGLAESREETLIEGQNWRQRDNPLAESHLTLNAEQEHALNAITIVLQGESCFHPCLLEGVTGSGKTEVYLQAIDHCLRQGKQALILIPEIGLTPQTLHRFQTRFAVPVVSFHSHLNDRERLISWRKARDGSAAILIGTRSALFTPTDRLGLIIVDEEHDLSYKQQEGFRYHARDLAIIRAQIESIPVVLGSATPTLESLYNAQSDRYQHLTLSQRAGNARPAEFRLLDIREKSLTFGLAPELIASTQQHLDDGQQVLMFINRRGYAPVLMCHDCGWIKECPHCDHRMTCHSQPPHVHCHHCNHQARVPRTCEHCHSTDLRPVGMGTERLEDNLKALFPHFPVIRIDRDTTQRKQAMAQHLNTIHRGKPCILVGTQMLAKGHHFPNVTLVAVCDIDAGLFAADFRATEHTAQLLVQVAGRSGRGDKPGQVLVQTHQPHHPLFQVLLAKDFHHFSQEILADRRLLGMPPFGYLALIRADSHLDQTAIEWLTGIEYQHRELATSLNVDIWGPAPALMPRKARRHRFQLMLRSDSRPALQSLLSSLEHSLSTEPPSRSIRWSIDVDPMTLD